jgi:two-component system, cell cycle response regulator
MAFQPDDTTKLTETPPRTYAPRTTRKRACLIQYSGEPLGRRYPLDTPEVTIGRALDNGIVLSDASVSRLHAKLTAVGNAFDVEDLGSRNGTFVNSERVQARTLLRDGEILRIGKVLLKCFAYDSVENIFHDKIYRMATIDAGTQVFNKMYLLETLDTEFNNSHGNARPLSVIYYDLDYFKRVNDVHGHRCGDYVLRESAKVAKSCVRQEDVLARYGGEEFVIVLPNADGNTAAALAERIRSAVEQHPFAFEGKPLKQTISIGVSELQPEFKTCQDLLDDADRKLYQSKNAGRNRVVR